MSAINSAIVVGGGITGLSVATLLAKSGIRVELLEARRTADAVGSGITLQGNALRMLDTVGVYEQVKAVSALFGATVLRAPDDEGTVLFRVDAHKTGGPDYPAGSGSFRPDLARILAEHAAGAGVEIRERSRVIEISQDADSVTATTDDGYSTTADLLIGADGLHSTVRDLIGIEEQPEFLDFGVWRAFAPLASGVDCTELIYGGSSYYTGYTPTGPDTMYAFIVDDYRDRSDLLPEEMLAEMQSLAEAYHGPWDEIKQHLVDASTVNYTRMSSFKIRGDWHRGRVALIGDAAHSCPPTLAQGAGQGLEDAVLLAQLLVSRDALDRSLWDEFYARRLPRANAVVDGSLAIAEHRKTPGLEMQSAHVMNEVSELLAQPM